MSDRPHPYAPAVDPLYDHQLEDLRANFRAGGRWGFLAGVILTNIVWLLVEVL